MKAAVLTEYGRIEWRDWPEPVCGPGQVLIGVRYASICGSDIHVFKGEFHPRTPVPFVPGHEFAGVIEQVGEGVTGFAVGEQAAVDPIIWCGRCAACRNGVHPACTSLKLVGIDLDGGFAERIAVKASMAYKVPASIAPKHAALVEILSIGFHACRRAEAAEGKTIAIFGAGRVGQSILQAARTKTSAQIYVVDILPGRLEIAARNFENVRAINALEEDAAQVIRNESGGGVDIAFEAVGHASRLDKTAQPVLACVESIRGGGTVCVLGLGDEAVPVVFKRLIWKEAKVVMSRVSGGEFADAIAAMAAGRLKPDALITETAPMSRTQEAIERILAQPEKVLKVMLKV